MNEDASLMNIMQGLNMNDPGNMMYTSDDIYG